MNDRLSAYRVFLDKKVSTHFIAIEELCRELQGLNRASYVAEHVSALDKVRGKLVQYSEPMYADETAKYPFDEEAMCASNGFKIPRNWNAT